MFGRTCVTSLQTASTAGTQQISFFKIVVATRSVPHVVWMQCARAFRPASAVWPRRWIACVARHAFRTACERHVDLPLPLPLGNLCATAKAECAKLTNNLATVFASRHVSTGRCRPAKRRLFFETTTSERPLGLFNGRRRTCRSSARCIRKRYRTPIVRCYQRSCFKRNTTNVRLTIEKKTIKK